MRKAPVFLAIVLAGAVSASANAASKKSEHHHHHHAAAATAVGSTGGSPYMDATDEQRAKFFHDALFPFDAK